MVTEYHRRIAEHISNYGGTVDKVREIYTHGVEEIAIPYPDSRKRVFSIYYDPDVYYILRRTEKYVIFEAIDSQDIYKTISDILRAYICQYRIHSVFFVTYNTKKRDKIINDSDVITSSLNKRLKDNKKIDFKILVIVIPKNIINSQDQVFEILNAEVRSEI